MAAPGWYNLPVPPADDTRCCQHVEHQAETCLKVLLISSLLGVLDSDIVSDNIESVPVRKNRKRQYHIITHVCHGGYELTMKWLVLPVLVCIGANENIAKGMYRMY